MTAVSPRLELDRALLSLILQAQGLGDYFTQGPDVILFKALTLALEARAQQLDPSHSFFAPKVPHYLVDLCQQIRDVADRVERKALAAHSEAKP